MGTSRNGIRHTVPLINQSVQSIHKFTSSGSAVSRQYFHWFGPPLESTIQWVLKASRGPQKWTPSLREIFRQLGMDLPFP